MTAAIVNLVISGALGRLGRRIVALAEQAHDMRVVGRIERPGLEGEGVTSALDDIKGGTVLIEAATPDAAVSHVTRAAAVGAAALVATTGLGADSTSELRRHQHTIPLLIAPNLSLGVAVLADLVRRASSALRSYDLEILEAHHGKKRDAPSGTAWALARAAAEARGLDIERAAILARAGDIGPRSPNEIGLQSIRGGDIIGEHTVFLIGETERIELVHKAQSRDVFAAGAIAAARFLAKPDRAPGLYSMHDVLAENTSHGPGAEAAAG